MGQMIQVPFGRGMVSRMAPAMTPDRYKTYGMSMPLKTHWRSATCEEADCQPYRHGWVTTVDLGTELGRQQHHFITHDRERRYSEQRVSLTLVKFVFGPGNPCFNRSQHRVPLQRPARFIVARGDWRGFIEHPRVHQRAEDWVEDFSIHQDRIKTAIERG